MRHNRNDFNPDVIRKWLGVSILAISTALTMPAVAQVEIDPDDEIIVTGIRASLERAQDIKRNADGVIDSISAEDIGKFPDTNLAESLQRITGVSINRVNGEGSQVTVRGFGASFNLVTLNGRTLPGGDNPQIGSDFRSGSEANTRSFDFSNLASEAVSGIDVYKTGNATLPSGGIGATVDIKTPRPLDNPGFSATVGVKGVVDTSVVEGSDVTPEISGSVSWTDESEKIGLGLFGSFQQRDSGAPSGTVFRWQQSTFQDFLDNPNFVNDDTVIVNAPTDPDQLVGIAIDSRLNFSEFERERLNLGGVAQFSPVDNFTATFDALYARNDNTELRSEVANWFGSAFEEVVFDTGGEVATAQSLTSDFTADDGSFSKDTAFAQRSLAIRDEILSFGLNLDWRATDELQFILDGHISSVEVAPNQDTDSVAAAFQTASDAVLDLADSRLLGGALSDLEFAFASPATSAQTQLFFPGQAPVQIQSFSDTNTDGTPGLSITDVGTTFVGGNANIQDNTVNEIDFKTVYTPDDSSKITLGFNYRDQENEFQSIGFFQLLGNFGINNVGDLAQIFGEDSNIISPFSVADQFSNFPVGSEEGAVAGQTLRPGSAEDLITIFDTVSPIYSAIDPDDPTTNPFGFVPGSSVQEEIISLYGQFDSDFDVAGRPARFSIGLRYEETDLVSAADFTVPQVLSFIGDNDFNVTDTPDVVLNEFDASYTNFLPHANFAVDVTDEIVVRAAYSNTIARANFGDLSAIVGTSGSPGTPTATGAVFDATQGNPALDPIESDNFDLSVEWYYDNSSFVSVGVFHKVVDNFITPGVTEDVLLFPGFTDPTSGVAGTRSGDAVDILNANNIALTDANIFLLTSLVDDIGAAAAGTVFLDATGGAGVTDAEDPIIDTALEPAAIAAGADLGPVDSNTTDPEVLFNVEQPLNLEEANVTGIEIAAQHFFGDTGFGLAGSYTFVTGDDITEVDVTNTDPQNALPGLSDTANITGIYEKDKLSARVSFNWRDEFLAVGSVAADNNNPIFVDAFGQLDANITYNLTDNIIFSFEGINLTGENLVTFGRSESQVIFAQELSPRFLFGARYKF